MTISTVNTNPEIPQDRAYDLYDHYRCGGYVMFHQQRQIYNHLTKVVKGKTVIEYGCGNGVGSALLERSASEFLGTDLTMSNVSFATQLYPWITFNQWDIQELPDEKCKQTVNIAIAIDVLEHTKDPRAVIRNMLYVANEEIWISTPQGDSKTYPPNNPFHVREYTLVEMLELLNDYKVTVRHWNTWKILHSPDAKVTPLVYQVKA